MAVLRAISIVITTFIALHFAVWLWSVNRLVVLIDQQADSLRSEGWRVEVAAARYGGWPRQARVEIGPVIIAAHGLSVRAETVVAEAALVRPGPLTWRSRGHALRFGSGPERPVLTGDVAGEAWPDGVVLTAAATRMAKLFEAEALRVRIGPNELMIMAHHLRPLAACWAFGPTIESLDMRVDAIPPASSVLSSGFSAAPPQPRGEHFDIRLMHLAAAGMDATGRAELWIDAASPPKLDGIVHVAGYGAGLDSLAATHVIASRTAVAANAVLGLLATPDGSAEIPVRIEGGVLYAAQFALLRLPTPEKPDLGLPH